VKVIQSNISPLIQSQFPDFYNEDGPSFIEFVKAYYQFLESTNNPLFYSRRIAEYRDVDRTIQEFLVYFQRKYLKDLPISEAFFGRDFIKRATELYRSKGSLNSLKLIFNLIFNEDIEVYIPSDDILRPSNGVWEIPYYLELSVTDRTKEFIGKQITGITSGATAYVQYVVRRNLDGKVVDVCYISDLVGTFLHDELIRDDQIVEGSPKIIGSMTRITIDEDNQGSGYQVGDVVKVISSRKGKDGLAVVRRIGLRTGDVSYGLRLGGFGYTQNETIFGSNTKVYVSNNVLAFNNYVSKFNQPSKFIEFETVTQPLVSLTISSANTDIEEGDFIFGANSSGHVLATAVVMSSDQDGSNATIIASPRSASFITINTLNNPNNTGSFVVGEPVVQKQYNVDGPTDTLGYVLYANGVSVIIDLAFGQFSSNKTIYGLSSNCTANASVSNNILFNSQHFTNSSIQSIFVNNTGNGAVKDTAVDLTASATVVFSNNTSVGVFSNNRPFYSSSNNYIFSNTTLARAKLISISSGRPGGFKIGGISNTETIILNTDIISSNNVGMVSYLNVSLDSSNSNAASNTGFGFPAFPQGNLQSVIAPCLLGKEITVGSIISLNEVDPGANNTASPFVVEKEQIVASYNKRDTLNVSYTNIFKAFTLNETVAQYLPQSISTISVTNLSNTFSSNNHEVIYQTRSDGNTVYGRVITANTVGGVGNVVVEVANSLLVFDTSNTIYTTFSQATATPANVVNSVRQIEVRGEVLFANSSTATLRRNSFYDMRIGQNIIGTESGAFANVQTITNISSANVIGNNAIVRSEASILEGRLLEVDVIESGIAYENLEGVFIESDETQARGIVFMDRAAITQGRYLSERGFLNANKYIHDNNFYQEYSYQIKSGISVDRYDDIIQDTVHTVGTRRFGAFTKTTTYSLNVNSVDSVFGKIVRINVSNNTGSFVSGETVFQSNGSANVASATVLSYNSSLNIIETFNSTGHFVTQYTVLGASSNSIADVDSVNIQV
jgi:hypothetical protein